MNTQTANQPTPAATHLSRSSNVTGDEEAIEPRFTAAQLYGLCRLVCDDGPAPEDEVRMNKAAGGYAFVAGVLAQVAASYLSPRQMAGALVVFLEEGKRYPSELLGGLDVDFANMTIDYLTAWSEGRVTSDDEVRLSSDGPMDGLFHLVRCALDYPRCIEMECRTVVPEIDAHFAARWSCQYLAENADGTRNLSTARRAQREAVSRFRVKLIELGVPRAVLDDAPFGRNECGVPIAPKRRDGVALMRAAIGGGVAPSIIDKASADAEQVVCAMGPHLSDIVQAAKDASQTFFVEGGLSHRAQHFAQALPLLVSRLAGRTQMQVQVGVWNTLRAHLPTSFLLSYDDLAPRSTPLVTPPPAVEQARLLVADTFANIH